MPLHPKTVVTLKLIFCWVFKMEGVSRVPLQKTEGCVAGRRAEGEQLCGSVE